ncbi:unnamed protein product [Rotaria magnacalcarata]|uniref:Reverse transcriptase domain-containing protein n=1 Tax=Rotaria magnacalcarata TaxID=392030 RepID=A0A820H4W3_9BILA|nr:unnamed protein product [Rotaria magnacalcarata]
MEQIFNESKAFKQLVEDPTIQKEDKLQRKLLQLKNIGFLTDSEYKFTRPVGSQPGKAYGLLKIHKDGVPLRPIISACGTFNYKLSKLLVNKLKHLRASPTIVIDTFKFVKELQNIKLNTTNIKMVSFDIVSLFTRVPLACIIDLILDKMYGPTHTCSFRGLKRADWCSKCQHRYELKWLLDISTKDSHFIFYEKLYCQTEGIAMGSPLGPLLADIYINYLESKLKRRLEENGMLYWKRFVDDCFVLVNENTDINKLLDILNSFDVDIQFTVETEKNHSISFLDILITRTNIDVNKTGLNTLPIEVLHSFLTITKRHMSIIRAVQYEQLLNILRLQYQREKLNNQKSLMLVPILYPAPTVFLSTYRASQLIDQINFEKTHLNYLQQEITSLIYKPNYIGLICYAFDNVISKTSLKISSDYFTSLREILKLNQVQELLLVFALQDSIHVKCQALARGHVLKWLPEFFQTISNTLKNDYPLKFVRNQIKKTLNRHFEGLNKLSNETLTKLNESDNKEVKKEQVFIDLPFIGIETKTLGKKIIDLAKNIRPDLHIQPIPRPPPAITTFFPQKDKINKNAQSNIVYSISCSDCDVGYIEKTIRQASRRHQEHGTPQQPKAPPTPKIVTPVLNNQSLRRSDRLWTKPNVNYYQDHNECNVEPQEENDDKLMKSALYKHQMNMNHTINWNDWKIISKDCKKYRLLVRESLQILHKKTILNRTMCSVPLVVYLEGLQISKPTVKIKFGAINEPRTRAHS